MLRKTDIVIPIAIGAFWGGMQAGERAVRDAKISSPHVMAAGLLAGSATIMTVPYLAGSQLQAAFRWFVKGDESITRTLTPGKLGVAPWALLVGGLGAVGALSGALMAEQS